MIDYTQYAFQKPVSVVDPIPTVADYLDDYTARNQAWYEQWAYPIGEGQWGARPESFQVRAPWTAELLPEAVLPPVIRETGGDLTSGDLTSGGEAFGSGATTTRPEDRPEGQLVRDPADLSDQELWDTYALLTTPGMEYGAMLPGAVMGLATGVPALGFMGRVGQQDYADRLGREMDRRITEALALGGALPAPASAISPEVTIKQVGTPTLTDVTPSREMVAALATGPDVGGGVFQRVGTPSYVPEPESRGGGDSGGYSSADRSGSKETTSEPGGIGGV